MDPDEPLAGTWKINDAPTMTGWDFTTGSVAKKGDIFFIVEHDQGSTKFSGFNVDEDAKTKAISICYWPLDDAGYGVYDSANGGWNYSDEYSDEVMAYDHTYNQTIKIMSVNWRSETVKNYVTTWLQANATKIS